LTLDPGAHVFEASAGSAHAKEEKLLAEGADPVQVVLALEEPAKSPAPAASEGSLVPAIASLAVGIAGVGVGSVVGLMASSKANAVKTNCVDGHCLASDAGALDDARSLARISTIAFIAGGVGLAAAGVFFVWRPGAGSPRATATIAPNAVHLGAVF
jgi:hypothetical protein